MKRLALAFAVILPVIGCGSDKPTETGQLSPGGPVVEYPEWVNKGSGAFGGNKKEFFAVGSAFGIKNPSLLRKAAENSARAEMQKLFSTYTASLMKQFAESVMAGDPAVTSESQMVSEAIKTFSAGTLSGVEIVDRWVHPTDGTMYALARLDLDGFSSQIDKAKELSGKVKEMVKRAAEKSFADLEAEEAKHKPE